MKKIFALVATASLLFSCSQEDITSNFEKLPINLSVGQQTRANDSTFENEDEVGIYVVNYDGATAGTLAASGNQVDNERFTYNNGAWTPDETIYWKDQSTAADFYAYYPYSESVNISAHPFSVMADQSTEDNFWASDFLWGKTTGVAPTKDAVGITVKHAMSNVIVKLVAGNGYTAEDIASASVAICGLKTNSTINLATGAITPTGDAQEITPMVESDYRRALVVPQSISNADLIKVTIGDKVYTLNQSIEFKSGKQHTCTLTVERTNQGINIGIDGWETESDDFGGTVE